MFVNGFQTPRQLRWFAGAFQNSPPHFATISTSYSLDVKKKKYIYIFPSKNCLRLSAGPFFNVYLMHYTHKLNTKTRTQRQKRRTVRKYEIFNYSQSQLYHNHITHTLSSRNFTDFHHVDLNELCVW